MKKYVCGLLLASALVSCTKTEKIIERLPPENAAEAFSISDKQKTALTLKKEILGKAFLLMASSKTMGSTPMWKDHPAKVVSFEKAGDRMGLYELNTGNVYENIPAVRLLQTFRVTKETETEFSIDLGKGFQSLNISENLEGFVKEGFDRGMLSVRADMTVQIVDSLIKSKELTDSRLTIVQDSRIRENKLASLPKDKPSRWEPKDRDTAVKHYEYSMQTYFELIPYQANENFKSLELDEQLRVGLFTLDAVKPGSAKTVKLTERWDVSASQAPIRFILSNDIPAEYIPDIEQGLKYWNRVFGKEVLTVEQSKDSDLLPQDRAVLVRWVNWHDAGFAYAGFQADPLTGEILRGQIFVPDFWMKTTESRVTAGFKNPESFLKYNLSHMIAHEAGHVFGLRHNFSASNAVKPSFGFLQKVRSLFKEGRIEEEIAETSTSVMEYSDKVDTYIAGKMIRTQSLSYDKDLIEWAYLGKAQPESKVEDFCTDDHLAKAGNESFAILGCERGDKAGNLLLLESAGLGDSLEENILSNILNSLVPQIYPKSGGRVPLPVTSYLSINESAFSESLKNVLFEMKLEDGTEKNKLFSIGAVSSSIIDEIKSGYASELTYDSNIASAIEEVFKTAKADPEYSKIVFGKDAGDNVDLSWADGAIQRILANPTLRKGKLYTGQEYSLTDEDIKEIAAVLEIRRGLIAKAYILSRIYGLMLPDGGKTSQWDSEKKQSYSVNAAYRSGVPKDEIASVIFKDMVSLLSRRGEAKLIGSELSATEAFLSKDDLLKFSKIMAAKSAHTHQSLKLDIKSIKIKSEEQFKDLISKFLISKGENPAAVAANYKLAFQDAVNKGKVSYVTKYWVDQQNDYLTTLNTLPDSL